MGAAYFYHLTRRPLDQVLPQLLDRSLAQGWRVLVRGRNPRAMEQLDLRLWTGDPTSFLPHGMAGGAQDADQPVLLALDGQGADGRHCVISVEGAEVTPEEVTASARVCVLFDGMDGAALDRARGQWRALTKAGVAAQYWSEESGKWEKKAETPAPD
ncbi:DNA polymerase III subunit chi [Rhodobacteraceae bacterium THAF1]|uniref:DNA polymerase III subunit chi n=1 Tax=Palleronia sp. THAF1 TaxID=2587842 RepID=UPI000F3C5307|nr:DNA polymerase III subunit chi [Palleronia sp. THAF1]QFU09133.1 DNA polymerase III subunit chi [Palleronia sp. THAF1]VDC24059.1 DNA polymerase III subunit chi [Rhodobacteraceae bacterium THAF1]